MAKYTVFVSRNKTEKCSLEHCKTFSFCGMFKAAVILHSTWEMNIFSILDELTEIPARKLYKLLCVL